MNLFRNAVKCGLCAACLALALSLSGCGELMELYGAYNFDKGVKCTEKGEYEQAFKYYKNAAEADLKEGLYNLGMCYLNGTGTQKNEEKAFICMKKAADMGFKDAYNSLGVMYDNGYGTAKDLDKSHELFKKAADCEVKEAYVNYARSCYRRNEVKDAKIYFQKAADAGLSDGYVGLGLMYIEGIGVKRNIKKGSEYMKKDAAMGSPEAAEFEKALRNL